MVKAQFSQDQAFQLLLAAVQAGKIDLPFLKEFKSSIKRYPDSPFADVVERDWQNFFKEATGAAKLDAAYLFSFYLSLTEGLIPQQQAIAEMAMKRH